MQHAKVNLNLEMSLAMGTVTWFHFRVGIGWIEMDVQQPYPQQLIQVGSISEMCE